VSGEPPAHVDNYSVVTVITWLSTEDDKRTLGLQEHARLAEQPVLARGGNAVEQVIAGEVDEALGALVVA
jgi:hypothetical protein